MTQETTPALSRLQKKINYINEYIEKHYTTDTSNSLYALLEAQAKERRDGIFARRRKDKETPETDTNSDYIEYREINIWDEIIEKIDENDLTFQEKLLAYIDRMGIKDSEYYNSLNLSKQMFSKLRSNKFYQPSRNTVMASCIRLHLDLMEANDLMGRAGFAFSPINLPDMVVKGCIEHKVYDLEFIESVLQEKNQPTLLKY